MVPRRTHESQNTQPPIVFAFAHTIRSSFIQLPPSRWRAESCGASTSSFIGCWGVRSLPCTAGEWTQPGRRRKKCSHSRPSPGRRAPSPRASASPRSSPATHSPARSVVGGDCTTHRWTGTPPSELWVASGTGSRRKPSSRYPRSGTGGSGLPPPSPKRVPGRRSRRINALDGAPSS